MRNKIVLNSPRILGIKKKKRKAFEKKILFLVAFFVLILIGLCFLSRWEKLNINSIDITGNKVLNTEAIQNIVKENITGYYLGIIPKTNFAFYPKQKIEKELLNNFKRIKNVSISVRNLTTLDISLTERTALYTYCGNNINLQDDLPTDVLNYNSVLPGQNQCYFMDDSGYIFDQAPYFSGNIYLKFYGANSLGNYTDPSGSYFFKPNFLKLTSFEKIVEEIGVKPVIFYIKDNGDIGMFLSSTVPSQMGPEVIFKANSDFNQIAENLQTVLTTDPFQTEFQNKYSSLLYIDLRFGNKVYYKFK